MLRFVYPCLLWCLLLSSWPALAEERVLDIARFSQNDLSDWEEKEFEGQTEYSLIELDQQRVLKAKSQASASGLFKKINVDIKTYPFLNWRWRIAKPFPAMNETLKSFDDYVVRLYVVRSGGLFFWKTKALNYVWSSREQKHVSWPNAFAPDNAHMMALRSAHDEANTWYVEKRNVYQDLKNWLGEDVEEIDAIAIMTDTDNTELSAEAYYGDIYFTKE